MHAAFEASARPATAGWMKTWYFSVVSVLLLALSVLGFSDNLFTDIGQPSNSDPKFVVHGLFCLAWMMVFVAQANLVRTGRVAWHRRLGIAGLVVAVGVTVSTVYVFAVLWKGWDAMPFFVKANRIFLVSYALCVLAAAMNRRRSDWHKRLILVGTLYMLEPILSRASGHVGVDVYVFIIIVWNALFLSLFAYDWSVARRIHPVTWLGFAWFYLVYAVSVLV